MTPKRNGGWPAKLPPKKIFTMPTPKPIFAVDLDSTIYNMEEKLQECVRIVTGVYPKPSHTWECEVSWGVSPTVAGGIWDLLWEHDLQPFPGAYNFLNNLRKHYRVVSLSTRKKGPARNHGLAMTEDLPVDQKIWTSSPEEKAAYLLRNNVAFFLDDSAANHLAAAKKDVAATLLLLDKPWNQSQDIDPVWTRVFSYDEVLKIAT